MRRIYSTAAMVLLLGFATAARTGQAENAGHRAELRVTPELSLVDQPLNVRVNGLTPGAAITIEATLVDPANCPWKSRGVFNADDHGLVDTSVSASVGGTYDGVDGFGLLWSMKVSDDVANSADAKRCRTLSRPWLAAQQPHEIHFSAVAGGQTIGAVTTRRTWMKAGTHAEEVADGRLRGTYFEPANVNKSRPVILMISGSGGGLDEWMPALLASHGYPALAVAYFGYKDLPKTLTNIPLEYFNEAAGWARRRTGQDRVVAIGASRGTEPVLLSAANFPKFADAIVLYVPSHLVESGLDPMQAEQPAAWSLGGKPLPFVPMNARTFLTSLAAAQHVTSPAIPLAMTPGFLERWMVPDADSRYGIPVERIHARVLLLAGANDTQWPSWIGAKRISERLKAAAPNAPVEMEVFQGAGHSIMAVGAVMSTDGYCCFGNFWMSTGGVPRLNAAASRAAFNHTLRFLQDFDQAGARSGGIPPSADATAAHR